MFGKSEFFHKFFVIKHKKEEALTFTRMALNRKKEWT